MTIVIDVWGGDCHLDHIARFLRPMEEALTLAAVELSEGFLVNLWMEAAWGPENEFDLRKAEPKRTH